MISLETKKIIEEICELKDLGLTEATAIQIIQTAAIEKLASAITSGYDGKPYLHIHGSVATYEQ